MNAGRRKDIAVALELMNSARVILENAGADERTAYDALPESIQDGERGQAMVAAADALEEAANELDDLFVKVEEASQ